MLDLFCCRSSCNPSPLEKKRWLNRALCYLLRLFTSSAAHVSTRFCDCKPQKRENETEARPYPTAKSVSLFGWSQERVNVYLGIKSYTRYLLKETKYRNIWPVNRLQPERTQARENRHKARTRARARPAWSRFLAPESQTRANFWFNLLFVKGSDDKSQAALVLPEVIVTED